MESLKTNRMEKNDQSDDKEKSRKKDGERNFFFFFLLRLGVAGLENFFFA